MHAQFIHAQFMPAPFIHAQSIYAQFIHAQFIHAQLIYKSLLTIDTNPFVNWNSLYETHKLTIQTTIACDFTAVLTTDSPEDCRYRRVSRGRAASEQRHHRTHNLRVPPYQERLQTHPHMSGNCGKNRKIKSNGYIPRQDARNLMV